MCSHDDIQDLISDENNCSSLPLFAEGENDEDFQPALPSLDIVSEGKDLDDIFEGVSERGPFERLDPDPGIYEITKTLVLCVTLLPLRALAIVSFLLLGNSFSIILVSINFRRTHKVVIRSFTRAIFFACGFHWVEVYGDPKPDEGTAIMVCNHISFFEILYFMSSPSSPSFVYGEFLSTVPIIGNTAARIGGVSVDNKSAGKGGLAAVLERVQKVREAESSDEYPPLLVFPEGTNTNGSSIISFRSGAFVPGVPVKPVLISMPFRHFSTTWESIYVPVLAIRMLCQFHNRFQVRYLPEYKPSAEEIQNPKLFAENVRTLMANAAHLPLCDASYADKKAYHQRLAMRLQKYGYGPFSIFSPLNPPALKEEARMEKLVYRYRRPRKDAEFIDT